MGTVTAGTGLGVRGTPTPHAVTRSLVRAHGHRSLSGGRAGLPSLAKSDSSAWWSTSPSFASSSSIVSSSSSTEMVTIGCQCQTSLHLLSYSSDTTRLPKCSARLPEELELSLVISQVPFRKDRVLSEQETETSACEIQPAFFPDSTGLLGPDPRMRSHLSSTWAALQDRP